MVAGKRAKARKSVILWAVIDRTSSKEQVERLPRNQVNMISTQDYEQVVLFSADTDLGLTTMLFHQRGEEFLE